MQLKKIKWDFQDVQYGFDTLQRFDMICGKKDVHAIVYIHGGAFFTGNKSQYPSFLADYSESNLVAAINYRVINIDNDIHIGDILSDVNNALEKIIEISNANGINIKDFILVGHSAGGHIVLLYGYKNFQKYEKIKIAACISLAGPTDFTDDIGWPSMGMWGADLRTRLSFYSWLGTRLSCHKIELTQSNWTKQKNYSEFKKYVEDISPVMYVSKIRKVPPTLLVHGRNDNQVPYSNAVRLKTILSAASAPHKLITPTGSGSNHLLGGVAVSPDEPTWYVNQTWVKEAKEWLETYLQ